MSQDRASFDWTPERCEQLRTLWADNSLSAAKIAVALGTGRMSVIGKARRMGLPARAIGKRYGSTPRVGVRRPRLPLPIGELTTPARRKPHVKPLPIAEAAPIAPPAAPEPVPTGSVRMVDLEFWHCRWPAWGRDGAPDGFLHCGQPKSDGAYCEKHARLAHSAGTLSERRAA